MISNISDKIKQEKKEANIRKNLEKYKNFRNNQNYENEK